MNISPERARITRKEDTRRLAELFRLLGQPARLRILLSLSEGEACVCHLEAALGLRQAYISQQLMLLRDAGLVSSAREGRNIFYRLADLRLPELIASAARQIGVELPAESPCGAGCTPLPGCPCPHCAESAGLPSDQIQQIGCDTDR